MALPDKLRVANPIAVRRFGVVGQPGREVVLTIGNIRRWMERSSPTDGGQWFCAGAGSTFFQFTLTGLSRLGTCAGTPVSGTITGHVNP
jgi:hypothetical protein